MSKTLLNASSTWFDTRCLRGMEKFIFEELSVNPSFNLAETDSEKLFVIENNPTMSCMARNFHESRVQTFAQIPPEKRSVLFKALTVFCPIYASNAVEAGVTGDE